MKIEICTHNEAKMIVSALNTHNLNNAPAVLTKTWTPLDYVIKNTDNQILGGILSGIGYWGGLEIKILWVKEEYREQGIGSKLLKTVEDIALSKGAKLSILDTFDFQAEQFYVKNGYQEFGRLDNFPKGHQRIYLSKKL